MKNSSKYYLHQFCVSLVILVLTELPAQESGAASSLTRLDLLAAVSEPLDDISVAQLVYDASPGEAKYSGTLILCPGQNGDGAHLLVDGSWQAWARSEKLAVVALRFVSSNEKLEQGLGYFRPRSDLNALLFHGLRALGYPTGNLYLAGFSGGARFIAAFLEKENVSVAAFSVLAAQTWPEDRGFWERKLPPGIVACGELDGPRLGPTLAFYQQGRKAGLPWTWVMLPNHGHHPSPNFDHFTRVYFSCQRRSKDAGGAATQNLLIDYSSLETLTRDSTTSSDASPRTIPAILTTVLPCADLFPSWLSLHQR